MRKKDPAKAEKIIRFVNAYYLEYLCTPTIPQIAAAVGLSVSTVHHYLVEMTENGEIDYDGRMIVTDMIQKQREDAVPVWMLGSVPCGPLTMKEDAAEGFVMLPVSIFGTGELYILQAEHDSMKDAGIDPGDWLVIQKQEFARKGDLVVAFVEGEGNTLKRYLPDPERKRIILHPENREKQYPDIVVKACRIQGIVRNVIKRMNYPD